MDCEEGAWNMIHRHPGSRARLAHGVSPARHRIAAASCVEGSFVECPSVRSTDKDVAAVTAPLVVVAQQGGTMSTATAARRRVVWRM